MKKIFALLFLTLLFTRCNSGDSGTGIPIALGTCGSGNGYINEPCVSVTICAPGGSGQCQTIPDVLLDTGSYGLRVFSSLVVVPLTQEVTGGKSVAECVPYADGTSDWGPIKVADVILG